MINAVNVQTRGCEVNATLRAHFEEKLHSLEKLWSRLEDAQVRVTLERGQYAVELTVIAGGLVTRAEERNHDCRQAFDAALHKAQAQLKRYKEKIQHRGRRQNNRDDVSGKVLHPLAAPGLAAPSTVAVVNNGYHHEEPVASADPEADAERSGDSLVRVKRFALKPMSADEASLQMDLLGHTFFVFRDAENNQVSVVYKRDTGGYGLIEPVPD